MTEKRDYLFDNIKGLIIFLVVWEHFAGITIRAGSTVGDLLCTAVLMFHMSVMMFVSGYFSKNLGQRHMEYNIRKVLIPYLVITVMVAAGEWIMGGGFRLRIFNPSFALWYIVVLFGYRMLLPYMDQIKGMLIWSFPLAFLSGMLPDIATYHTLGRFFSNLPFFLLGYYCKEEWVRRLRSWMGLPERVIYTLAFMILTFGTAGMILKNSWDANIYRNNTTYNAAGMSDLMGMGCRFLFYLAGCFAILCFLACFTDRKSILCKAGKNSMVVYFFHIFVYRLLEWSGVLKGGSVRNFILIFLLSAGTVAVLSMDIWTRIFGSLTGFLGDLCFGKGEKLRENGENPGTTKLR